jgi:hypothetical protein
MMKKRSVRLFFVASFLSFISSVFVQPVNEAHKQRLALVRRSATGEGAEKRPTTGEAEGSPWWFLIRLDRGAQSVYWR